MSYTLNNWLDLSNVSNLFKSIYVKGFVDISGGDFISRNGNLYIAGNSNLNNAYIGNTIGVGVSGSIYPLDVSGSVQIRNKLVVWGDASINGSVYTSTPSSSDNSTKVATTEYVQGAIQSQSASTLDNLTLNYAPIASPSFSGRVTSAGDV
jgi:intein-encoded DNA endonuclease-like protein